MMNIFLVPHRRKGKVKLQGCAWDRVEVPSGDSGRGLIGQWTHALLASPTQAPHPDPIRTWTLLPHTLPHTKGPVFGLWWGEEVVEKSVWISI